MRKSADGLKTQFVNNTCLTSWADEEVNLQDWFVNFMNRDKKVIAGKIVREAKVGEEELVSLLRTWLKAPWSDIETSILLNMEDLFSGDFSELKSLLGSGLESEIIILLGVRTDESDSTKQYQQIYSKSYLPGSMWSGILNGFTFNNDYTRKAWERFDESANGSYGFNSYFEMIPVVEYDPTKDVMSSEKTKVDITPTNSKF